MQQKIDLIHLNRDSFGAGLFEETSELYILETRVKNIYKLKVVERDKWLATS